MADENTLLNSDLESRYEKYKGIIKNFTLMSDIFMRNVFKKRECLEYVLQVIMKKKDLHVIDQIIQKDYKNLQGRSAVWTALPGIPQANNLMWKSSRIMKELPQKEPGTIVD